MPLFTSDYLRRQSSETLITESKRLFSSQDKSNLKFDIFLSHSYLDRNEVFGLYRELSSMGYLVYVDWIVDSDLDRSNVTKASAELIRNRMKNSKSLLLAISTNAAISKWMPWELGYVDGNTNRCAIIPVAQNNVNYNTFERVEYLKLYPYLDRATMMGSQDQKIWVNEDTNTYVLLEQWISGTNPYKR
ncbi:TIR domain-containing protein [Chryseobacterium sediminis]|uniref:TIR domain-containing protein n=1 Tax=Chryseobacterium sediminis TaxID=1679494 RepID=A0A5B2UBP3_9FLAO|nr:TIR domain-containing protein [Chryseobacterium sediminis]KAA2223900.1 TIR domain-containing protein [Chryseobacterium sediminis]